MKFFAKSFVFIMVVCLIISGCSGSGSEKKGSETKEEKSQETSGEPTQNSGETRKVGLITGLGGLGDKTYNDLVYAGLKDLEKEGAKIEVVEPKELADYETNQRSFSESGEYAVIVCVGYEQSESLKAVAAEFPNQNYILIDDLISASNVSSVVVKNEENTFQIGALAGLLMKEGKLPNASGKQVIGVVGGMDIPLIRNFVAGYMAGAKYVNPDIEVLVSYVGDWNNPNKATELANGMYEKGAEIVWQAAGGSGLGVFAAAKNKNKFAMGVDGNQNTLDPDHIIASGIRRLDKIAYNLAKDALSGTFVAGGYKYGLSEGAVEVTVDGTNVKVDAAILDKVAKLSEQVAKGDIVVPEQIEDVDAFLKKYGSLK